jgi:hypothetical protein
MIAPPSVPAFDAFVDGAIRSVASTSDSFATLLARLPGIAPLDAVRALDEMIDEEPAYRRLLDSARIYETPFLPFDQGASLPLPHPLDMEWRFTTATVDDLLGQLTASTADGDAILLLGVPSVAAAAARSTFDREYQVTGEGNVICRALELATLKDPRFTHNSLLRRPVAAALIDPPWYPGAYVEMLTTCSLRCATGATVLLALPPVGIRPSARADQNLMLDAAVVAGFEVTGALQRARYRSPLFELAAWRAAGIGAWLPEWRAGEMVTLVKIREPAKHPGAISKPPAFELTLDGVRLTLLLDRTGPSELVPIVPGEVLPSVSARLPGRERATLWTSSNRAFAVESRAGLAALLNLASARGMVLPKGLNLEEFELADTATVDAIQALTHHIESLATREIAIAAEMVGDAAWLRNLDDARFSGSPWQGFPQIRRGAAA